MAVKCIAIGNRIMGDDGVGITVAEGLSQQLRQISIEVILGETDIDYAFSKVEEGDFLFILDSTYLDKQPGTVTFASIRMDNGYNYNGYSQHEPSLITLLKTYEKCVHGFIIGIEVEKIDFGLELSDRLKTRFPAICEEVYKFIYHNIRPE